MRGRWLFGLGVLTPLAVAPVAAQNTAVIEAQPQRLRAVAPEM